MKIIKAKDYEDMSRKAANIISAQVIMKPDCGMVSQRRSGFWRCDDGKFGRVPRAAQGK